MNSDPWAQVARRIDPDSRLLRTWPLEGGGSAHMTALELLRPDGQTQKWVVRRLRSADSQAAAQEFRLLQILHSAGLPVPKPYDLDLSGAIYPQAVMLIEYLEGQPEFVPGRISDFPRQMAAQLAAIHRLDSVRHDLAFLPHRGRGFGERSASEDQSPDTGRIRAALEALWPLPQLNPFALLHGDFWPGNLLWKNGRLVGVLDWEDAAAGDPLADVAVSRLDLCLIFSLQAMQDFTRHYQALTSLDFTYLAYWDLCAALRAAPYLADWAAGYPALGRPDITAGTLSEGHRWFTAQALERLK